LTPLFDAIINHFDAQEVDEEGPLQMLVSSIDYNEYVGRIGIGRIERGSMRVNQEVETCNFNVKGKEVKGKLVSIYQIEGLGRAQVEDAKAGVGLFAFRAKCSVLPIHIKTKNYRVRLFRKVTVIIGKPISYEELGFTSEKGNMAEYNAASRYIFERICELGKEEQV
jgi:translation elongation factor EF-G